MRSRSPGITDLYVICVVRIEIGALVGLVNDGFLTHSTGESYTGSLAVAGFCKLGKTIPSSTTPVLGLPVDGRGSNHRPYGVPITDGILQPLDVKSSHCIATAISIS